MICFVIYGVNIYVSKHNFNSFEKNVWYSNYFCWFLVVISMMLADFLLPGSVSLEADPDPADQNETDPDPKVTL